MTAGNYARIGAELAQGIGAELAHCSRFSAAEAPAASCANSPELRSGGIGDRNAAAPPGAEAEDWRRIGAELAQAGTDLGLAVEHEGQVYRLANVRPHTKPDGSEVPMLDWVSDCPDCGTEFLTSTTMLFRQPRRRCDACKKPGVPVRTKAPRGRRRDAGVTP